jgi:hypothetical protein
MQRRFGAEYDAYIRQVRRWMERERSSSTIREYAAWSEPQGRGHLRGQHFRHVLRCLFTATAARRPRRSDIDH